jgi:hypothetical protein
MTNGTIPGEESLTPDVLPWERQEGETDNAYAAFQAYLNDEKRRVSDKGPTARKWSMTWLWASRAREYDIYMGRVDLEEKVRYRRKMEERHRQLASVALGKMVSWLNTFDEKKIAAMSVADATRLFDIAVRIERGAVGTANHEDLPDLAGQVEQEGSFESRLAAAKLDIPLDELADLLHERLG